MGTKKKTKKRTGRRRGGMAIMILTTSIILVLCVAAGFYLYPYTRSRMDRSLLELPAINRPAVLLAYEPEARAERRGEMHIPAHSTPAPPERRVFVPMEEIPEDLIHAFVAIEDKRFYTHRGVDLRRTAHAAYSFVRGKGSFGGSTITQQLIKNLTGHDEATVDRKLTEIFMALDLERDTDKETILECYLNIINLADGCRGVGAAAHRYFSKAPADLTLAECATIAAITQNPARYNPIRHPSAARDRRDLILREMESQGYITPQACDAAIAAEISLRIGDFSTLHDANARDDGSSVTSWYTDMVISDVIRDLCDRLGYTRTHASELVFSGGLTIETAMDEDMQALVEAYYADLSHFPAGEHGRPQSSFILMDPATGDILAVAGAIGAKEGNRLQNYATDTRRPAGSCIKPLSLYAPAIEEGLITWATVLDDAPLGEQNGLPWPRNADGVYRGRISVGSSLSESVNTVAVRILDMIGRERSFAYLRDRFGMRSLIEPERGRMNDATISSLALGQQSHGVTSRELTAAYSAFLDGFYRQPISYHRVLDSDGNLLLENKPTAARAVSPETAALMTRLLESVTDHGTAARYITIGEDYGIASAGKTGTTQNNCDRRFVGYTPRLLSGVWMGYDYPTELRGISGNPCVRIWNDLMILCESTYRGAEASLNFSLPAELYEADFCPLSGCLPNPFCADPATGVVTEHGYFVPGTEPRMWCDEHEEPPIVTIPPDPSDPDRIPLFPDDLFPDASPLPKAGANEPRRWFSRWFSRFSE